MASGSSDNAQHGSLMRMAADIVSAYVSNNAVPASELPTFIRDIHSNLEKRANGVAGAAVQAPKEPAVPIKKSVTPDFIVCLEDGKKFKSLRRHLAASFGLSPDEYRAKWGLPPDYPMAAPNYSTARSALAKQAGFGQKPGGFTSQTAVPEANEPDAAPPHSATEVVSANTGEPQAAEPEAVVPKAAKSKTTKPKAAKPKATKKAAGKKAV